MPNDLDRWRDLARLGAVFMALAAPACSPCEYNTVASGWSDLSGSEVVPPVESHFDGRVERLTVRLREAEAVSQSIRWRVETTLVAADVASVHLHAGNRGEVGPVIAALPPPWLDPNERFTLDIGSEYEGSIPIDVLFERMQEGSVYVDIHTGRFPDGELRGQLELLSFDNRRGTYCTAWAN